MVIGLCSTEFPGQVIDKGGLRIQPHMLLEMDG
jgi:hypothetical protein